MIEWLNAMAGLWPRLLIAPLGPSVLVCAWLIGVGLGRHVNLLDELRRPELLIGPWSVLLLLPLPFTAPVAPALDLLGALLICEWRQLCGAERPASGRQALMTRLALCAVYALAFDRLTLQAVAAGAVSSTVTALLLAVGWVTAACGGDEDRRPGTIWRVTTLVVIGWLIAATALPWWQALLVTGSVVLLCGRFSAVTRLRLAQTLTAAAALITVGLRVGALVG